MGSTLLLCLCTYAHAHADEAVWVHVLIYPCTEHSHSEPLVCPMHSEGRVHMYEYACAITTHMQKRLLISAGG